MGEITTQNYQELTKLLDGRIDNLTKPIPSMQVLGFAEGIRSASGDRSYTADDYGNLLHVKELIDELLPSILTRLRAESINPETGWKFVDVDAADGDHGLCSICLEPFQHFRKTVKVQCLDMHPGAFHGVCRDCVREYATLEFIDREDVDEWLNQGGMELVPVEEDQATELRRVDFVDAMRRHAHTTGNFADVAKKASDWAKAVFGEWR